MAKKYNNITIVKLSEITDFAMNMQKFIIKNGAFRRIEILY